MAAVILFVLICVGLYFLYVYMKKEHEKDDHYLELAHYIDYKELHPEYARERIDDILPGFTSTRYVKPTVDQVRKYFKAHPEKLAEAEKEYKEAEERRCIGAELRRKDLVKRRVFAYDYEDMLFQIYAPTASDFDDSWHPGHLSKEYILQRIAEIKNVSAEDALKIFDALIKKNVISDIPELGVLLAPMLWDDYNHKDPQWNIVSNLDMTFSKWMDAHGYEHKKTIDYANNCK